jgi:hypothetical protein
MRQKENLLRRKKKNLTTMSDVEIEYSDEEQETSWDTAQRFKLVFGKYQGKRMAFMVRKSETREYLRYLLTWDKLKPKTKSNIECALDHYKTAKTKR